MKTRNLSLLALLLFGASLLFTSCDKDDDNDDTTTPTPTTGNVIVSSNITANTTWTKDKVYELAGRISVVDGVTLTIEAGTVIKGQAGAGSNATALLIARGGKLMAEGTATLPIIFTTVADEITPADVAAGNFGSPNLDPVVNGLWGGLIVLGKAPISVSGDAVEVQIEGIPTSDPNGLYGGTNAADNSGVLKYISIRHGGTDIGSGNEINGLSLGGVGSGTVIENIEVVSNQDDGVEFFGGAVNVSNLLVWNVGDDAIDTDQSWDGTIDNFIVVSPAGHCFELDGPEGTMAAGHTIKNGTVISYDSEFHMTSEDLINVDANSIVDLQNIHFFNPQTDQKVNRITATGVTFTGITINCAAADLGGHVNGTPIPAGITAGGTPQANKAVFTWTWANKANKLSAI
ncbi:MAG: hypothetical protein JXR34_05950 [Bacteroidales bacterium]|nr:hypothetical protein [Bacteroidales bacterium]